MTDITNTSHTEEWEEITPFGGLQRVETHLIAYGIAAMLGANGVKTRLRYSPNGIVVRLQCTRQDAAEVISHHLDEMIRPDTGWLVYGSKVPHKNGWASPSCAVSPFYGNMDKVKSDGKFVPRRAVMNDVYTRRDSYLDALGVGFVGEVVTALGVPQYWKESPQPSLGGSQMLMRAVNAGNDQLNSRISDHTETEQVSAQGILRFLEDSNTVDTADPQFGVEPTSAVRVAVAIHGLWTLPTSVGTSVAARTFGCVYAPKVMNGKDEDQVFTRNTARVVLPVFHEDVSVHKVRSVLSHRDWLPVKKPKKREGRSAPTQYVFTAKSRRFHREQGATPLMWNTGDDGGGTNNTYGNILNVVRS